MKRRPSPSFSLTLDADTAAQVRAAVQATGAQEGYASVNELLEAATKRELRRLQGIHNAGKPWPRIPTGILRPRRRTTEETNK